MDARFRVLQNNRKASPSAKAAPLHFLLQALVMARCAINGAEMA